ncbi:MAG: inositol-3-phosphate synthase [Thermoproteota archaeon]
MAKVRVAIAGVGNCASALVQGVKYYSEALHGNFGLLHKKVGPYGVGDIKFVAAFDVNETKVEKDLSEAIFASPNNTIQFSKPKKMGVVVRRGPVRDGIGRFLRDKVKLSDEPEVDVAQELRDSKADVLINYLPVGSERGSAFYADAAIKGKCAFINAMPTFIASNEVWQRRFERAGLPVIGDDVMSQLGATIVHKTLAKLLVDRGVKIEESYQLNVGGDADFLNMLEQDRLKSKRESKTSAVRAMIPYDVPLRIGPSDYVYFLENEKVCYIWIKGRYFGGAPLRMDVKLSVIDAPNSAGIIIDAVRVAKIGLDRGISGPLISMSAYGFKHPPIQLPYEEAKRRLELFIEGKEER